MRKRKRLRKVHEAIGHLTETLSEHHIGVGAGAEAMLCLTIAGLVTEGRNRKKWMQWISETWDDAEAIHQRDAERQQRRRGGLRVVK